MGFWGEWCRIPAGEVQIEGITYQVRPFYMAKYPVTHAQFQAFLDAPDGYANDEWWQGLAASNDHRNHPSAQWFKFDLHPREQVSWYDAVAYCRWSSLQVDYMGYTMRLPTEWEWRWAAQGDDGREYPWGSEFDAAHCNTSESGNGMTTPVDQYPSGASPFGVVDMAGNVWEWCLNEYESPHETSLAGDAMRTARGGSWDYTRAYARVTYRRYNLPHDRWNFLGFRAVAVDL